MQLIDVLAALRMEVTCAGVETLPFLPPSVVHYRYRISLSLAHIFHFHHASIEPIGLKRNPSSSYPCFLCFFSFYP